MPRSTVRRLAPVAAYALASTTAAGRGWVEKTVTSDAVTIDVERDGAALVAHEILLGIRGGPLPEFSVSPVDADAEVQEDATATLARSGAAAGFPIPLTAGVDGARLSLRVQSGKGLHSGTYLVRFRYRSNFANAAKIHPTESGTLVEWSGPSFSDGIDSARVVFRFPETGTMPRAPSQGSDLANIADDATGVFLSYSRRGTGKDEIELVRPHVAKSEVVTWRALVDERTFDPSSKPVVEPLVPSDPPVAPPKARPRTPLGPVFLALAALSLVYGAIVALKSRWTTVACERRRATAKPLVRVPVALRAVVAAAGTFAAGACVVQALSPFLAAACLLAAMAVATHLPPRLSPPLRGPGDWVDVGSGALEARPATKPRGRILDVATPLGFLVFAVSLAAFVAGAMLAMRHSPYYGVAVGLASAVLFPVFCTGRATELPPTPAEAPVDLIDWLYSELGREGNPVLGVLGRVPRGGTEPDELRMLVMPEKPVQGLKAIEVGLDVHDGPLGPFCLPFVIVRTTDGSRAAEALPKGLYVTRGRSVDERVVVLRPKLPTERMVKRLVQDLLRRFSAGAKATGQSERSTPSSAGKGSLAAKAGTTSSPAHAT